MDFFFWYILLVVYPIFSKVIADYFPIWELLDELFICNSHHIIAID